MNPVHMHTEVLVIGAGPGGYTAAIRSAQLGKQVTLVERQQPGGVCLHQGCIPSKALLHAVGVYGQMRSSRIRELGLSIADVRIDWAQVQTWKQGIVDRLARGVRNLLDRDNIEVMHGTATFQSPHSVCIDREEDTVQLSFHQCIIAAGSAPLQLQSIPFGGRVLSSTELLQLSEIPQRLAIIGGGYIGVELGQAFAKLGTKVTILEGEERILPAFDPDMSELVHKKFRVDGGKVETCAKALFAESTDDGIRLHYTTSPGTTGSIDSDYVLVAAGRVPHTDVLAAEHAGIRRDGRGYIEVDRQLRSSQPHIYAIGDVVRGPALAHKAIYEAKIVSEAIAGRKSAIVDYQALPVIVFSDPELASVGWSEKEAGEQGIRVRSGTFRYGGNGRALTMQAGEGFVKLIADDRDGTLLGAHIAGAEASNLIAETALAIEMGATIEDMALTIHAHPTLSEVVMEASEQASGTAIHSKTRGGEV